MMPPSRRVILLGSTGSIGESTLDVMRHMRALPDVDFQLVGLGAGTRGDQLLEQAREFGVSDISLADADVASGLEFEGALHAGPGSARALVESIARPGDLVVAAIVGSAGIDAVVAAVPEEATLEPEVVRTECTQLAALSEGKLRTKVQEIAAQLEDADDGSAQHTYLHKKLELGTEMFKRRPAVARLLSMWQAEALEKHSISDSADKLLKTMLASDESLNEELIKVEKQQESSPDNGVLAWQIKVTRRCICGSFQLPKRPTMLELLDASIRASGHTTLRAFILKSIVKPRAELTSLLNESTAVLKADANAQFTAANPRAAYRNRFVAVFKIFTL